MSQMEEGLRKQRQYERARQDHVKDAQAIESFLNQVHAMVTELHRVRSRRLQLRNDLDGLCYLHQLGKVT